MNCEHGFVVRDILGINRFLCRECDERFSRYPKRGKQKITSIVDKIPAEWIDEALNEVESGFVRAKGAVLGQVTYSFPLADKVSFSYKFIEDNNE